MPCGTLFVIGPRASAKKIARRIEHSRRCIPYLRAIKVIAYTDFWRELEEQEDSLFPRVMLSHAVARIGAPF